MNKFLILTGTGFVKRTLYGLVLTAAFLILASHSFSQTIKGTYAIQNVQNGMLLRIQDANKKDGTPLVAYSPVNWKCVTWDFSNIEGNTYQLRNLFTNKTFQPENMNPANETAMHQQPIKLNQDKQLYEFIPVEEDIYLIKLKNTNLYLTPADPKGTINSAIILSKKRGSREQHWTIYEQHPTL